LLFFAAAFFSYLPRLDSRDTLYQVSTLSALLAGDYDGDASIRTLKAHGDFGLGTFNSLDGEMVALGGRVYQVKYDGTVSLAGDRMKTPFAAMTFFDSDKSFESDKELDYGGLTTIIDGMIANKNIPYAVRVTGRFDYIKTRSVPAQKKPYKILTEVVKDQSVFEFRDIEGTIVGFRIPDYMGGLNAPGYHLHFISKDKKAGGHLLQCGTGRVTIDVDDTPELHMSLPEGGDFENLDLSRNRSDDIEKVEK